MQRPPEQRNSPLSHTMPQSVPTNHDHFNKKIYSMSYIEAYMWKGLCSNLHVLGSCFLAHVTAKWFYIILLYLAHQSHQQSHNLGGHRRTGWPTGTSHWHTETLLVGIEVWGWLVHRTLRLNGQHSLDDHCNAELVSNTVHCKVASN